jgi:hypothetical protein
MGTSWFTRVLDRLRGRRSPDEYYAWLLQYGRIVEGRVLDAQQDGPGVTIFYCYNLSNVQYESSQTLTPQQLRQDASYAPGATITVRIDPKYPARSIVQ